MLIGVFLRNIKVYKGQHYLPISDGQSFSALIGPNGVGKSSILEAIDLVLNGRDPATWNINKEAVGSSHPFVALVMLVRAEKVPADHRLVLKTISDEVWSNDEPETRSAAGDFLAHRARLESEFRNDDWLFCIIGRRHQEPKGFYLATFHNSARKLLRADKAADEAEQDFQSTIRNAFSNLVDSFEYFYLPVETDTQQYTKLETVDMQRLIGGDIQEKIDKAIGKESLEQINARLDEFIKGLGDTLGDYFYQAPGRKQLLTKRDLVAKIIEAYFSVKTLHKKKGTSKALPVSELSSGQKRRALVDVAYAFLTNDSRQTREVILAIDEPDASLDRESCFEQFEKLLEISGLGHQVLAATHWYGFLPIVHDGVAQSLTFDTEGKPRGITSFDLYSYPESLRLTQKRSHNELPHDVALKSHNDLVQSIASSILRPEDGYNWIVCEGTSDKIYLEHFVRPLVGKSRLRVIPVAGRDEVRRLYEYLVTSLKERSKEASGRVLCLIDTDLTAIEVNLPAIDKTIEFRRLLLSANVVKLVAWNSKEMSPETSIEDCLPAEDFLATLRTFGTEFPDTAPILDELAGSEGVTYSGGLDLKKSSREYLKKTFFGGKSGDVKVRFAKALVAAPATPSKAAAPEWATHIADFFKKGKFTGGASSN
jgi:hypothetical protein